MQDYTYKGCKENTISVAPGSLLPHNRVLRVEAIAKVPSQIGRYLTRYMLGSLCAIQLLCTLPMGRVYRANLFGCMSVCSITGAPRTYHHPHVLIFSLSSSLSLPLPLSFSLFLFLLFTSFYSSINLSDLG